MSYLTMGLDIGLKVRQKPIIRRANQWNVNEVREIIYFLRCPFLININTDRSSSIQGEYLAGIAKKLTSERNSRPFICRTNCARFVWYCEFLKVSDIHTIWFRDTKRLALTSYGPRDPCTRPWNSYVFSFLLIWAQVRELKLDDLDPSNLRPTHSTSTGSSDSAGRVVHVWLQLT